MNEERRNQVHHIDSNLIKLRKAVQIPVPLKVPKGNPKKNID